MNFKLVAIDCDGTLIDNNFDIPEKNIQVIRTLKEKGIEFVIITGRNDLHVMNYVKQLNISAPVIANDGASTRDLINDKIYSIHKLSNESLSEIWDFFSSNSKPCHFFSMDTAYYTSDTKLNPNNELYYNFMKKAGPPLKFKMIKSLEELLNSNDSILKSVYSTKDKDKFLKAKQELSKIPNVSVFASGNNMMDIVDKNVSKGNALLEYLKIKDISPENVIAIGDSENDLSMLEVVGFPVTLENGDPILKEIAKFTSVSNNEGGVGVALEKIFELC